ncbi:putative pyridoxine 5'-phosphate oxidase superfamily flavin-nucleotide-binding protein [Saonia flava]|uniref:Putative pyridoxine 5'-phosphate oxidase superfamily flavin-nucleotide-binding protein n=1 Tax=Saonia flava TaxID=523696 RepID=A0A846R6N5_9FLAO|nr:putative pyridoxine 5'-phosphate oxidase superfamily flavin-nucleotide-binding protein [Saonia flava]
MASTQIQAQFDTEYYLPPLWSTDAGPTSTNSPSELIISTSYPSSNVTIQTSDGVTLNTTITVSQGVPFSFSLSTVLGMTRTINAAEINKGLIITSTEPIQVVHINNSSNNKTYTTLKGTTALGTDFYAASQTKVIADQYGADDVHFISVMAMEDNTAITIQMPDFKVLEGTGNTVNITLNQYETYLVKTAFGTNITNNITGAHITSDKDIAVVSGGQHLRQTIGGAADGGVDQLVPIEAADTEYILSRGDTSPDYAIIVATQSNTQIFIDGNVTPVATLTNPGDYHEYDLPGTLGSPHYIEGDKPFLVFHVSGLKANELGMSIVPSILCRGSKTIDFLKFNGSVNLVNTVTVMLETSGISDFRFNNESLTTMGITPTAVPGRSDWSSFSIPDNKILNSNRAFSPSSYYHLGLLVGEDLLTGTFGFLSGFSKNVYTLDPNVQLPTPGYTVASTCDLRGQPDVFPVTLESTCGTPTITSATTSEATSNVTFTNTGFGTYDLQYTSGATSEYITDIITIQFKTTEATVDQAFGEAKIKVVIPPNVDDDGDGVPDCADQDDDNDGILDTMEYVGTNNPFGDEDGDNIINYLDVVDDNLSGDLSITDYTDLNADGTPDVYDLDGDGIPNHLDLDSDNDSIPDIVEAQPTDTYQPAGAIDPVTGIRATGTDTDGFNTVTNSDLDGLPDFLDFDSDNDGYSDIIEVGNGSLDSDGDSMTNELVGVNGLSNSIDNVDNYTDSDGTIDDPTLLPNIDALNDVDYREELDTDGDGIPDSSDLDDDNDGILDNLEAIGGNNPTGDADGDGIPNFIDSVNNGGVGDGSTTDYTDTNADGIPDVYDFDADGVPNHLDLDSDNDGIYDAIEAGHGQPHTNGLVDGPVNTDGIADAVQAIGQETSGSINYTLSDSEVTPDGTPDIFELDSDNDGCNDVIEAGYTDTDANGILGDNPTAVNANGIVISTNVVDGYTNPINADSGLGNTVYDFQQSGQSPIIATAPDQPQNLITNGVDPQTFTVNATGTLLIYQWQVDDQLGGGFINIDPLNTTDIYTNSDSATLTLTGITSSENEYQYRVIVTDSTFACGSTISSAATLTFDDAATITIDTPIEGDGVANATESADVTISGTTTDVELGQTVTVTFSDGANPNVITTATVDAGGTWTATDIDISGLDTGNISVNANVTDLAGNTANSLGNIILDNTATIDINTPIEGDALVNAAEDGNVSISGTTTGVENLQTVTVTFSDGAATVTTTATVNPDGTWTATDADISGLVNGPITVNADVTDVAGNPANELENISLDNSIPIIDINTPIEGDALVNAAEDGDVSISGTTTGVENLQTVTVTFSDGAATVTTTATVNPDGSWTATDVDISGLVNGPISVNADVTDVAGNPANDLENISLDTLATIDINTPIEGDALVNASEDGDVSISGTTTGVEDNQTVTVTFSDGVGTVTTTAVVTGNSWTATDADISALVNGPVTVNADVTDVAGNPANDLENISLDTLATIDINTPIEGDALVNDAEDGDVSISGTTTGVEDNQTVTVTFSDGAATVTTTATVNPDGSWTATDADISGLVNGPITVNADVTDVAGNPANDLENISLDTLATIDINTPIEGDALVNDAEDGDVSISGTTTGVEDNQTVTVTFSDGAATVTTTATVNPDGSWTATDADISGLVNGPITVNADVTDIAGNPANDLENISLDTLATIDINTPIEGDGVINAIEASNVIISGSTIGIEVGQTVSITFSDGVNPVITTTALIGSDGTWSTSELDISSLKSGNIGIDVIVSDLVGNTVSGLEYITMDSLATITIDNAIEIDNIVNSSEATDVTISGRTTEVEVGQTITVTLSDGVNPDVTTTAIVNLDGTWIATDVNITGLNLGSIVVQAVVVDSAGNSTNDTHNITLDINNPIITSTTTNDPTPIIMGLGEPFEVLIIGIDVNGDSIADTTYDVVVDSNGNWTLDTETAIPTSGTFPVLIDGSLINISVTDINNNMDSTAIQLIIDTDGDTINDGQELLDNTDPLDDCNSINGFPLDSSDCDNDGLTTIEEINLNTDPFNADSDGDSINDGQEIMDNTDPLNGCESIGGTPPATIICDTDGDGILDNQENIDGTDPNNDCESMGGAPLGTSDCDNDGLTNDEEAAIGTDPNNSDSDGDTIIDGQEIIDNTNPLDDCDSINGIPLSISDCDSDGLTNSEEEALGTDPRNPDTDGDNILDGSEVNDQTNPLDSCDSIGGTPLNGIACDIEIESDLIGPGIGNGSFKIKFISLFPNNTVEIYNRWGVMVYKVNGYDNNDNAFKGLSNARATIQQNEELPVGVYFYLIKYFDDDKGKTKSGYLYINK